mgnify:CR=1 FL=1
MKISTIADVCDLPDDLRKWMGDYIKSGMAGTPEEIVLEALRLLQVERRISHPSFWAATFGDAKRKEPT